MPEVTALLGGDPALPGRSSLPAEPMPDLLALLGDAATRRRLAPFDIAPAQDAADLAGYRRLRRQVFADEQGLFDGDDHDDHDDDPRTVVLLARDRAGALLGGVRLHPADAGGPDLGWWYGSRLAVSAASRNGAGGLLREARPAQFSPTRAAYPVGPALVRAACAYAEAAGVLRFDATVQPAAERMFRRLGWVTVRPVTTAGQPHQLMRWAGHPSGGRIAAAALSAKAPLGALVAGLAGEPGFVGDDGAPVPGSDLVAACDAIVPSMVERDPEWAGWCAVLVNVNDLCAMGAAPVGLLDALGARDATFAARVLSGLRRGAEAYGVPVLGGHTQLGVPAALSVTALGRVPGGPGGLVPGSPESGLAYGGPVPGGGGRPGHSVRLTADLGGQWRPGYTGRQWDSTSHRSPAELRAMVRCLAGPDPAAAARRPAAAKDVSMAGIAGTLGMLAEASGCGAVLDVARVPRPTGATMGDWLTCFPGFGLLTAAPAGTPFPAAGPAVTAVCGELTAGRGVRLRWPDGEETVAITDGVTGLGPARGGNCSPAGEPGLTQLALDHLDAS
jgi:putative N-acetyltransferase (TIGR04045 family)